MQTFFGTKSTPTQTTVATLCSQCRDVHKVDSRLIFVLGDILSRYRGCMDNSQDPETERYFRAFIVEIEQLIEDERHEF